MLLVLRVLDAWLRMVNFIHEADVLVNHGLHVFLLLKEIQRLQVARALASLNERLLPREGLAFERVVLIFGGVDFVVRLFLIIH